MTKKIDYRFKILYAIGSLMIVAGHCKGGSLGFLDYWFPLGGMHLSLFVFASGYFYNDNDLNDIKSYIIKKIKKLIVPLYIYNLIYALIAFIMSGAGFNLFAPINLNTLLIEPITSGHQFALNLGSWFIAPLFLCEIFNILIRKLLEKFKINEIFYFILYSLIGILLVSLAIRGLRNTPLLLLERFGYFLPFYGLGILYKKQLEKYDLNINNALYIGIIFLIKLIISFFMLKMPSYTPSNFSDFIDGPIMPFIVSMLGVLFWFRICSILEASLKDSKLINIIADSSFSIMMNQFIGFFLLKGIFAFIAKNTRIFSDFDFNAYHNDLFYYYLPHGQAQMLILYVFMGIFIPILIQKGIDLIKKRFI